MATYGIVTYAGASGAEYEFTACSWDQRFKAAGAVYFITKRTPQPDREPDGVGHTRIYVGQTEDLSERLDDHHKASCFKQHAANCICVHPDDNENSRLTKENDLIESYHPPCNG